MPETGGNENKHAIEARIIEIKLQKHKAKTKLTRHRNKLKDELSDGDGDKTVAKEMLEKVEVAMGEVIAVIYKNYVVKITNKRNDRHNEKEIETIEQSYEEVCKEYNETFSDTVLTAESHQESNEKSSKSQVDIDLSRQMKNFHPNIHRQET